MNDFKNLLINFDGNDYPNVDIEKTYPEIICSNMRLHLMEKDNWLVTHTFISDLWVCTISIHEDFRDAYIGTIAAFSVTWLDEKTTRSYRVDDGDVHIHSSFNELAHAIVGWLKDAE